MVFVLHVGIILVFSDRPVWGRIPYRSAPVLLLVDGEGSTNALGRSLALADPMLFALPESRGFAGGAWRVASRPQVPATGWREPQRWLPAQSNWFGATAFDGRVLPASRPLVEKPAPSPSGIRVARLPLADRSRLELDPVLAQRGLAVPVELPAVTHSNLLAATSVQVCVQADGAVFSAVILASSGWKSADDQALALALAARFQPLRRGGGMEFVPARTWGRMVFRWYTEEPGKAAAEKAPS
jgi:TonB family protein